MLARSRVSPRLGFGGLGRDRPTCNQGGLAVSRERRLGRGLEALLGRAWDEPQAPAAPPSTSRSQPADDRLSRDENGQVWLNCDAIARNPYQPRQTFDEAEIADLADSIRTHGILQPLVVRRSGEGFELIAGERRLRAAQAADWRQVPVQIRDVDDRQMAELAIVENVQRKDLNAIEKAESFQRYIDQYQCTQEELAGRVQVDRSTVANLIRLLELPADVKKMVQEGDISQGHARALLPLGRRAGTNRVRPEDQEGRPVGPRDGAGRATIASTRSTAINCESSTPKAIRAR